MSNFIQESLDLPLIDELLYGSDSDEQDELDVDLSDTEFDSDEVMAAKDHEKKLDEINKETMTAAKNITTMGFNADIAQSNKLFDSAAVMFKIAMESANAKREYRQRDKKLSLDAKRLNNAGIKKPDEPNQDNQNTDNKTVVYGNRNDLLNKPKH